MDRGAQEAIDHRVTKTCCGPGLGSTDRSQLLKLPWTSRFLLSCCPEVISKVLSSKGAYLPAQGSGERKESKKISEDACSLSASVTLAVASHATLSSLGKGG